MYQIVCVVDRSAPVSKSRACVNDVRQKRLSLPLHGIHEEDSVEQKTLHDPACGFNSVSEENEVCEEYVFDRSILMNAFNIMLKTKHQCLRIVKKNKVFNVL